MVSRNRLVVYLLLAYAVLEISLDNALVFLNLTGRRVPSVTVLLLGALGVPLGVGDPLDGANRIALALGVVGLFFVSAAVWQLLHS